jgi:acetylornithine aminotransferase
VRFSPVLNELGTYPFARLDEARRRVEAAGVEVIDFGVGDPREPTHPLIRQALVEGVRETMAYPRATGLPELRAAISGWIGRRFRVAVDPDTEIVPTLGAKEAIFSFAQLVADPAAGRDLIVTTEPGYPVADRGARFAGLGVHQLALREENGFLPDLGAVEPSVWARAACVWVNYPNNPTGAMAPLAFYERLAALALEYDFLVASDEAYTELYFGSEAPVSALQAADRSRLVVFQSLSKRSSMTGYRCGFVAGSREVCDALRLFRPSVGTAPQEFVQRAAIAAWSDEAHVAEARERYRRKRSVLLRALARKGLWVAGSDAGMYLWVEAPAGEGSEALAQRLLEHGILVAPGSYLGPSGEGYVRFALVPGEDDCRRAASILEEAL